jgi:hypothetical protein
LVHDQPPPALEPLLGVGGVEDCAGVGVRLVICWPEGVSRYQGAPNAVLASPLVCPAALSPAK